MSTTATRITAEEYAKLGDSDRPTELVRGEIVEVNVPGPRHGMVCGNVARIIGNFAYDNQLGRIFTNDSGIITGREPDTVRGPDFWYVSFEKLPKDDVPFRYIDIIPDLAVEVLSPDDRWSKVLAKVAEYLDIGIPVVCVLDPENRTAQLFHPNEPGSQTLSADDGLNFPTVLPGFSIQVGDFFE